MELNSIAHKIVRNTRYNILGRGSRALLGFVLTAYMVHRLGIERYGLLVLLATTTQILNLVDIGFGSSFVKHIAEYHSMEEKHRINEIVSIGTVYSLVTRTLVSLLIWVGIGLFFDFLKVPSELRAEAQFFFGLGLLAWVVSSVSAVFVTVQTGFQRMDLSNGMDVAFAVLNAIGTVIALELGFGLSGIAVIVLALAIVALVANVWLSHRIFPFLRLTRFKLRDGLIARLSRFGVDIWLGVLAGLCHFQLDKILLSHFCGIQFVTMYDLAARLALPLREFPLMTTAAIMPAASELKARNELDQIRDLYRRSSKAIVTVAMPILFFGLFFSQAVYRLWLGPEFQNVALVFQLLLVSYLLNAITDPAYEILNGMGFTSYGRRSSVLAAVVHAVLGLALIVSFGLLGAAVGVVASMAAGALYFLYMAHRELGIKSFKFWLDVSAKPTWVAVVATLSLFTLLGFTNDVHSWIVLVPVVGLGLALFYYLLAKSRYFDSVDVHYLGLFLGSGRKGRKLAWALRILE